MLTFELILSSLITTVPDDDLLHVSGGPVHQVGAGGGGGGECHVSQGAGGGKEEGKGRTSKKG